MLGGIIMAFVIVLVIPVGAMMSGSIVAAVLGWSLKNEGDAANEGSELIALNK